MCAVPECFVLLHVDGFGRIQRCSGERLKIDLVLLICHSRRINFQIVFHPLEPMLNGSCGPIEIFLFSFQSSFNKGQINDGGYNGNQQQQQQLQQKHAAFTDGHVRSEPITLATLDRDCFIIPVANLERFLPAGVPVSEVKRPLLTCSNLLLCTKIVCSTITRQNFG